ncbi:FAD-linked oxidoreductase [Naviculisporaceae sp. PSN 640]
MKLQHQPILPLLLLPLVANGSPVHFLTAPADDPLLSQLNQTLKGRLQAARPLAASCFSDPAGAACASLKQHLSSPFFKSGQYNGFQNLQGEACISDPNNQCPLSLAPSLPTSPSRGASFTTRLSACNQGSVSEHYVEVTSAQDVQAVFDYARNTPNGKPRLSIKNSGHDYNMRSSARQGDSQIAFWTRNLRSMAYNPDFVPSGCTTPARKAITLGAGVSTTEAMSFAHANGVSLPVAGSNPTVGIAGGWVLNGGHGVLTSGFGLGVDRVLEFRIVTPASGEQVVNACQNEELFWALRGGGAGSFGVVLEATFQAEEEEKPGQELVSAMMMFPLSSGADGRRQLNEWVDILAEHAREWALAGWGGPSGANLSVLANPFLGGNLEEARRMLAPAIEFVERQPGGFALVDTYPSWYEYFARNINSTAEGGQDNAVATFTTSRLIPQRVFQDGDARAGLVDVLVELSSPETELGKGMQTYFLMDLPLRYSQLGEGKGQGNETSLHPAWRESVWSVVSYGGFHATAGLEDRRRAVAGLRNVTKTLEAVAPDGCTYANEADPWTENWETQFWGEENYQRLLRVKQQVDPEGLLSCWHCVGWTPEDEGYGCVSGLV